MSDVNITGGAANTPGGHQITIFDLDQLPHNQADIDLLYRIYVDKRIEAQAGFYQGRIKENIRNADFTFAAGALVMTISSLIATISATVQHPFWTPVLTVLSAMLPALAALMASFRQLYGWERQASIYRDALLGLERVRLLAPDNDRVSAADLRQIYPQLVTESETVFTGEVSQWGQFVVSADQKEAQSDQALRTLFSNLELNDDQRAAVQAILSAGKHSDVRITSTVKQVPTTTPPTPSTPPTPAEPLPMDSIDLSALANAASSEVGSEEDDIVPPDSPLPDDEADNSVG